MGNLTKNLSRHEFACECGCGFDTADYTLINILQSCVDHFADKLGRQCIILISGPNRCRRHNTAQRDLYKATNGLEGSNASLESQHIYGRAADFKLFYVDDDHDKKQIDANDVASWIVDNYPEASVGRYNNRTHVDSRTAGPAYWDTRS